jgi:hypothetical protein
MFVGAKHDRIQYGIITNNLSAVMLRPPQKPDAPGSGFKPILGGNIMFDLCEIASAKSAVRHFCYSYR